jgi:hypothetical protein
MAPSLPTDPTIAQMRDRITFLLEKIKTLRAEITALDPAYADLGAVGRIVSDVTNGASALAYDLTWWNAAKHDQEQWLVPIQQPAMELGWAIDRIRPETARRAGWRGQAADEYVRGIFAQKPKPEPPPQTDAVQLLGHLGRMTNGGLGGFFGDVKNYGQATLTILSAIAAMTVALISNAKAPSRRVFWAGIVGVAIGTIAAYTYYRSAREDYLTNLRMNTRLVQKLAWESAFFQNGWPDPVREAGWPYMDGKQIKFRVARQPKSP